MARGGRAAVDRRPFVAVVVSLVVIAAQPLASGAPSSVDGIRIPRGYRVVSRYHPGTGVAQLSLVRRGPDQSVNVARLAKGSPNRFRVLLSNGAVSGPSPRTERTSAMCRRHRCLVAVNGDFFTDTGVPVGGVIDEAEPMRSPPDGRYHFSYGAGGSLHLARLSMSGSLTAYYPRVPSGPRLLRGAGPPEPRTTTVDAVNKAGGRGIVLYTPRFGPTTETGRATELIARIVAPSGPLRAGVSTTVELVGAGRGRSRIPRDGVVLAGWGDGASALAGLWRDAQTGRADRRATLTIAVSGNARQSVGGEPVLVRDARRVTASRTSRAPRTMIGWNSRGDILLVTADGRQPGRAAGLTLVEAAELMRALGAVHALNLDGGGSTTFVRTGRVVNRPSGRERPVAVAVAIVRAG